MSILQREVICIYKQETYLNISLLSKIRPMVSEISKLVFKENAFEKPTQNLFNHLCYYLVTIIDVQAASKLPWPLYDSQTERKYRNELYNFITANSNKGLTPVMSSYFVNPNCFKVVVLMFQMSSLALNTVISQVAKDSQKSLINEVNEMYKGPIDTDSFVDFVEKKTQDMQYKLSNYLIRRQILEEIASKLQDKIVKVEKIVSNTKKYINGIVDNFVSQDLDEISKQKILSIKNVNEESPFFDEWLTYVDCEIDKLDKRWDMASEFLNTCRDTADRTRDVVMRYTGQTDKNTYLISYNPKADDINTKDLENRVNIEQQFILKNIIIDGKLNFPNLIRAFVISISFILKNIFVDAQIYKFNEYLEIGKNNMQEILLRLRSVMERISNAEGRLEYTSPSVMSPLPSAGTGSIYPGSLTGPSLSNLKAGRDFQDFFDTFTPLPLSKQKFNLYRGSTRIKQPLITPFQPPKDDFMKSLLSYNVNPSYDTTRNSNISSVSHVSKLANNETVAGYSSGFTKHQIERLLSTKKTSSSKKYKYSSDRPINFNKCGLTYDSGVFVESNGLTRSYSSPNLFENREKRPLPRVCGRKLAIMEEDSPFQVSGVVALGNDSNFSTPGARNDENSRESGTKPIVVVSEPVDNVNCDLKVNISKITSASTQSNITPKNNTPKTTTILAKKSSSIERIINKLNKIRHRNVPPQNELKKSENCNNIIKSETVPRLLLPDLLSPGTLKEEKGDSSDEECCRPPRNSLGTLLGVDESVLDQFDLID